MVYNILWNISAQFKSAYIERTDGGEGIQLQSENMTWKSKILLQINFKFSKTRIFLY
jgi:hypothetical protein